MESLSIFSVNVQVSKVSHPPETLFWQPPQQRGGLVQGLLGSLMQQGFNPQQAGIQNTNPYSMSPGEAARLTGYAAQQQPDLLHQVLGPGGPLGSTGAKLAVAGIAALAAKQILGGGGPSGMRF